MKANKAQLREYFKEERKKISPKRLQQASEDICLSVLKSFQVENKLCSIFLPIERQKELNTYQILEKAVNIGAKFTLPVSNFKTGELSHVLYTEETSLEINPYGIPEPVKGKKIAPDKHDIVFVPLLAADKKGNRVGYGKGFYDRFLSKCKPDCIFVGLNLFDPVEEIEDVFEKDQKLHYLITPENVIRF